MLIDGGIIPNLALMKYTTYFKDRGYNVSWNNHNNPDIVVGSILFNKDKWKYNSWKFRYPKSKILVGGPGYDPKIRLPKEVEICKPDYSIYPKFKNSLGRVTIGCKNNCYFCKVPQMGKIRYVQPVWDFYREGSKYCRILDDNIFQHKKAWNETYNWLKDNGVIVDFDALDIRLINEKVAKQLLELKHKDRLHFSFDILTKSYERSVRKGVQLLHDQGISKLRLSFYVYLHDEKHIPDAMKRWKILREIGVEPFLMMNIENFKLGLESIKSKKFRALHKRGDRPGIWRGMTTEEVFSNVRKESILFTKKLDEYIT